MIRTLALPLAAAALALAACGPAQSHSYDIGDLKVGHPWSRPAAEGMNGAGYLSVVNAGTAPDRLVAVETPAAARVQIHETSTDGGVMRMRLLEGGLPIAAGERVELAPGGTHIMFLKLTRPLAAGEKIPATLVFEKAGRLAVEFSVQAGAGRKKSPHDGH